MIAALRGSTAVITAVRVTLTLNGGAKSLRYSTTVTRYDINKTFNSTSYTQTTLILRLHVSALKLNAVR